MIYRLFFFFCYMVLSGCAHETIRETMPSYIGQPVNVLIARLGFPTAEQTVAGQKVYIWTTGRLIEGTTYDCKIRAIVGPQDLIISWDYEGNEGGCANYARRLR